MSLTNGTLVTIDDFSNQEIEAVFSLADQIAASMYEQSNMCQGKILANMFFEPSTRTRCSFDAAMLRLGGRVMNVVDMNSTSLAKGESIADMARVIGGYADIIVIRHPREGAAKIVADYAGVPVINAGDGAHEHPTQTLCDLYTIKKERKTLQGMNIALWGDLKYGRTIHSLTYALARFGATIHFRPGPGLELPEHVERKLNREYQGRFERFEDVQDEQKEELFPLDAIYITPSTPHQLANIPSVSIRIHLKQGIDAIYVTRLQKERHASTTEGEALHKRYPTVDKKLLEEKRFKKALVLHPLPRIDELAHEVDADPRSRYFEQAKLGVPIRMALISLMLGAKKMDIPAVQGPTFARQIDYPIYDQGFGVSCQNPKCVSVQQTETKHIKPKFRIVEKTPLTLACVYCEHEIKPPYIASSEKEKAFYTSDSVVLSQIKPEHLIIFGSENDAIEHGFRPSKYAASKYHQPV